MTHANWMITKSLVFNIVGNRPNSVDIPQIVCGEHKPQP